jgi:transcriptional regulator with XRE-family HTH domain
MVILGERIRLLRDKLKQSQAEIADIVGIHSNAISKWKRSLYRVTGDSVPNLASALNTPDAYFIGETDDLIKIPSPQSGSNNVGDVHMEFPASTSGNVIAQAIKARNSYKFPRLT